MVIDFFVTVLSSYHLHILFSSTLFILVYQTSQPTLYLKTKSTYIFSYLIPHLEVFTGDYFEDF